MSRSRNTTQSGLGGSGRAHRRFFLWLIGIFALLMLVFSFINTWVNPLWLTPAPWTDTTKFADYRQISRNQRSAKAGLVRSKQWEVAFLGSSRVAIALDPAMPEWGDRKVVNLALSGGSLTEHVAMVDYIIAHQHNLKQIYLGVDLVDLTTGTDMARNAGFYESPLNPAGDAIEREIRYVAGTSTFLASVRTITTRRTSLKHPNDAAKMPPYTQLGHWLRHRSVRPARDILYTDSIPHAVRLIRQRKANLEIFEKKLNSLKRIIDTCQRNNIQLTMLIPPNHAIYLSVFYIDHDADPVFKLDRETIVKLAAESNAKYPNAPQVKVWDFNDFHPLNAEPLQSADASGKLHYWADGTHGLETLGHVMLKRMNGWTIDDPKERDYGREIDVQSLPSRLDDLRAGFERYGKEHPEEIQWIKDNLHRFSVTDKKGQPEEAEPTPQP